MADAADAGLFLGLISGTSADGIDAALVRFSPRAQVVAARTFPYPADLRAEILAVAQDPRGQLALDRFGMLDVRIARAFADAAVALMQAHDIERSQVTAIGSHGQTLRHRVDLDPPFTLQLGDPSTIAERTGITTVADFRRRDVAAGGQGAPLAPGLHDALFRSDGEDRAVLNLGGIANLTLLPRGGDAIGFDSGPANALMDAWCARHTGQGFDSDGAFAASGRVLPELLERLLADPYFALPPPKSTGREQFHLAWLEPQLPVDADAADVQATLLALTVESIARAVDAHVAAARRVIACGGGVRNAALMRALRERLAPVVVESSDVHGIDPDFVEAAAFAWMARETLAGRPGNLASVTGARGPRVLGGIYPAG